VQDVESAVRPVDLAGINVKASSRRCEVKPAKGLATTRSTTSPGWSSSGRWTRTPRPFSPRSEPSAD